ncbi:MAG: UbiX family flavin prenyltransferase [Spirochaetota bacterium]|nr:UbiX family flavin prenyltransferase [Spirochaetota bacterium]
MRVLLGITGASGSILCITLIKILKELEIDVLLTATKNGIKVCEFETNIKINDFVKSNSIQYYDIDDLFSPPSSGTFKLDAVVVIPCSMGTLSRIAQGTSSNLLERSADVALKEKKKLILSPRETPINSIHLENMLKLSRMGVVIIPPSIAFYTKPKTVDDIINFQVGKILDQLGVDHTLFNRWDSLS